MRTLALLAICILTAGLALGSDAGGKWKGSIDTPNGAIELNMNFKVDGASLTGTVGGGPMGDTEIKDGKVDGDNITFAVVNNFNGNEFKIEYKGKVAADTITFEISFNGQSGPPPFTVKRAQ